MPPPSLNTRPRLITLVTAGVSATVLLTVLSLLILVDHFAIDYARREAEQRLQQLAWQMRDALNGVVHKATADVQLLSALPRVREARNPAEVRLVLESLQKTFPDYAWIGLATPDGKVFAATQGVQEGADVSARAWFQAGRGKLYAGDYPPAALPGQKLPYSADPWRFVDAAGPVLGADGQFRGVLCVRMGWGWARRMVQTIFAPASRQYTADIFVVRSDVVAILGPQGKEEQKISSESLALTSSGGSIIAASGWPMTSERFQPSSCSACRFHSRTTPPGSSAMKASCALSRIARSSAARSCSNCWVLCSWPSARSSCSALRAISRVRSPTVVSSFSLRPRSASRWRCSLRSMALRARDSTCTS